MTSDTVYYPEKAKHVGTDRLRHEDSRLLTGRGCYASDLAVPGMLVAAMLRSPFAHARLGTIDTAAAGRLSGVVAVFTADDLGTAQMGLPSFGQFPKPLIERWQPTIRNCPLPTLAKGKVRFVGQAVAMVVADSREIAEDALELIEVEYEALGAVTSMDDALAEGAPLIHEDLPDNVGMDFTASIGDVDAAFERAAHVVRDQFEIQRYSGMSLEGRGLLAVPQDGGLMVRAAHQMPHFLRSLICDALRLPQFAVRVTQPDIGGGFGQKAGFYPEDVLVPFAAHTLQRPVKWVEDKSEQLVGSNHSRQQHFDMGMAFDGDHRITGLRFTAWIDTGGYLTFPVVLSYLGMCHHLGPYRIPAMRAHVQAVLTNKTHSAPSRGAGRPEAVFAQNRIMDRAAEQMGLDPLELRRRNFISPDEMPYNPGILYRDGNPMQIESGQYAEALDRAAREIGYDGFKAEQTKARQDGRLIGLGIACNIEAGGIGPYEYARVLVDPSGKIALYTGLVDSGQGHKTAFAQVCADELGIDPDDVMVAPGDTNFLPYGRGTYHSRAAVVGGNAVRKASLAVRDRMVAIAASHFQLQSERFVVVDGRVRDLESDRSLGLGECAKLATPENSLGVSRAPGLDETAFFEVRTTSWGNAVHAAVVEVDAETGALEILRYLVLHDCGRMINPLLVRGQMIGGVAQGIGGTVLEDLLYDADGNPLATTMQDYILPRLSDIPDIQLMHMESPSPLNPMGIKGAGEAGTIGPPAALAAAVENALGHLGVRIASTPVSPHHILGALRKARAVHHAAG